MEFIKNNWVLLLILAIIIYLVYSYYKKSKLISINQSNNDSNIFSKIKNVVISKNDTTIQSSPKNQVNKDYNIIDFKVNDKIYADELLNTYTAPSVSSNTLNKTYNRGDLVGTYIKNDGKFIQVLSNEGSLGINVRYVQILNNKFYKN